MNWLCIIKTLTFKWQPYELWWWLLKLLQTWACVEKSPDLGKVCSGVIDISMKEWLKSFTSQGPLFTEVSKECHTDAFTAEVFQECHPHRSAQLGTIPGLHGSYSNRNETRLKWFHVLLCFQQQQLSWRSIGPICDMDKSSDFVYFSGCWNGTVLGRK